jgi:hypothetical protein
MNANSRKELRKAQETIAERTGSALALSTRFCGHRCHERD